MVEKILGERQAEDIFFSAMLTGLVSEKQASDVLGEMEKDAAVDPLKLLSGIWKATSGLASAGWGVIKEMPATIGWTAALGGGLGALGANAYDAIKKRMTEEDPETKLRNEKEMIYASKERELKDSKWMDRARRIRDALRRAVKNKKVTNEQYKKDYEDLISTLEERV